MAPGLAHSSNMENILKELQHVCSGTSDWFVPEPYQKSVQSDILSAIRRFKNVVSWKEFWGVQNQSTKTDLDELNEENEESRFMSTGLNPGLKPTFDLETAKHGSDNLEGFLTAVRKTLLKEAFRRQHFERQTRKPEKYTKSFKN